MPCHAGLSLPYIQYMKYGSYTHYAHNGGRRLVGTSGVPHRLALQAAVTRSRTTEERAAPTHI